MSNENELMIAGDDDVLSMMEPSRVGVLDPDEAGLGLEDLGAGDAILPRIALLQAMSVPVSDGADGAEPGVYWMSLGGRPLTFKDGREFTKLRFVVVKLYPAQRRWRPLTEGGGLICEAPTGQLIASEPNGVAGAKLVVSKNDTGEASRVGWEGGEPTSNCRACVHGLGASSAATGAPATGRSNGAWLPKTVAGVRIPDELRAPACTSGLDALVLVACSPVGDLPGEIVPAFISFSKTSMPAGRQLAGMLKMSSREPAWGRIFELGNKKVTNDKGTFFVATVRAIGSANSDLRTLARELFESSQTESYRPHMEDTDDVIDSTVVDGPATVVKDDGDPNGDDIMPDDQF